MSEDRYRQLQDTITDARVEHMYDDDRTRLYDLLLDVLQAILDRHSPSTSAEPYCQWCTVRAVRQPWPCPDVLTVETALTNMGALND